MSLSTHVLDASLGRPAQGVPIQLRAQGDAGAATPFGTTIFTAVTDADGRYRHQQSGADLPLAAGIYDLQFDTTAYFTATGQTGFYPRVTVTFEITDPAAHHHVPLLLSPFAFSTYRGS
ncbi:hydroxyisourate hydrolase [Nakamurella multipartita]|uniref:5-hydroxyisourate hydrolase n=1 Tax=Nakamurella multipartita (strain ATCC 700099 / DSM 44233 / CIP 104796 / JCM 9543 / NBRC 105858 / Y-104) TaxID=479431 RepID=C8XJZ8_NAKMY|nr:hydroxyisourate hydrolase [Nakamurella multipartita]ACV76681.1 hydroxyisourate hydrolase [Nakamurella multipartita DSM 44233]